MSFYLRLFIRETLDRKEDLAQFNLMPQRWEKFGDCAGAAPGPEKGVTILGDKVEFRIAATQQKKQEPAKVGTNPSYEIKILVVNIGPFGIFFTM